MAMTKDDIISMAREANLMSVEFSTALEEMWVGQLERFANLVAAAEREKCVKELKIHGWGYASKILSPKGNNGL